VSVRPATALGWRLTGGAFVRSTGRSAGDLGPRSAGVEARWRGEVDVAWSVADQVHGRDVVVVDRPGAGRGVAADGLVTHLGGVALAVVTADCAPVALSSPEGVIGVAHAGWRGLEAGVLPATVAAMRALGASRVDAVLGPCIHPACYEFAGPELDRLVAVLGPGVAGTHTGGGPALDVPAAVAASLAAADARLVAEAGVCTSCSPEHWSWRARADTGRQATVVWRP
jgi:YfiH family protein